MKAVEGQQERVEVFVVEDEVVEVVVREEDGR